MKRIKALALALTVSLAVIPAVALADFDGEDDDVVIGDFGDDFDDDVRPAIPEPSGALVMGTGLGVAGLVLALRRRR